MSNLNLILEWKKSPAKWVESMFNLTPQPLKPGFVIGVNTKLEEIDHRWFEPFVKGKHITWQQWVIFLAIERGLAGGKKFISVASGHGCGKSSTMALALLWFLFCFKDAQIPCTAPTSQQMFDVLWKEVAKWHGKLPDNIKDKIEVESAYVRIKERPKTWFARAATARKESPEALAGIHADNVFLMVDEASAIPEEVFITGEGALTNKNAFILLISNYTRLSGYFHDTQENKTNEWQNLRFSSADSPIVEQGYVDKMKARGEDSAEFRVRVLGLPPKADVMIKGYVPLLNKEDLRFTTMPELVQPIILGIDPSGQGRNKTAFVLRDPFKAVILGTFLNLKTIEIAQKSCEIIDFYKILPENAVMDTFGVGADVLNEFMKMKRFVTGVLVGNQANEKERFLNLKAEMYWRMREWVLKGGQLTGNMTQWQEILGIRYSTEVARIKIMGKLMMQEVGLQSPDIAEAFMLTFLREQYDVPSTEFDKKEEEAYDPYDGL